MHFCGISALHHAIFVFSDHLSPGTRMNRIFLSILIATLFASCAVKERIVGVNNTFLQDVDVTKKHDNMPFAHSAMYGEVNSKDYSAIYIKPVRIDTLSENAWETSIAGTIHSKEDYLREAGAIAEYFHEQLIQRFQAYPDGRLRVVDQGGPGVAVVEIALTELQFSHPLVKAASMAVPVPGAGTAVSAIADPYAAMAIRITDSNDGRLLATIADRKFAPTRIVDLNKFSVTSSLREICEFWSEMIVEAFEKGPLAKVERRGVFSILPW